MKKKTLVIGANSTLAKRLIKLIENKNVVYKSFSNKKKLDKKDFNLNLNDEKSILNFSESIKKTKFKYIILCPGIIFGKSIDKYNYKEIDQVNNVNYVGITKLFNKIIRKNLDKKCVMIFISSISGRRGSYDHYYAGAKAGLISFAKSLSKYHGDKMRINIIAPSLINKTKMYYQNSKKNIGKIKKEAPNKHILSSDELAKIIKDMMQSHCDHTNGSIIDVNGGVY